MRVAAVIVSWNVRDLVGRCIESLRRHLPPLEYTITVVDNDSSDGTADFVRREYPGVDVVANSANLGFAAANNQAAKSVDADILLLANPDTELQGSLLPLLEHFKDSATGAVFGQLFHPDGTPQEFIRNFPTFLNQVGEILGLPRVFPSAGALCEMVRKDNREIYGRTHAVDSASGAFVLVRRSAFVEANGFDEDYFLYGEETDLFFRFRKLGYKALYDPAVRIVHHHGSSTAQLPASHAMMQRGRHLFVRKNYSPAQALIFRYLLLVAYDMTHGAHALGKSLLGDSSKRELYSRRAARHLSALRWELLNRCDGPGG